MRFISVCTVNPTNRLPTEAEMASIHKFIVEGMKAGWLFECEGVTFASVKALAWSSEHRWFMKSS